MRRTRASLIAMATSAALVIAACGTADTSGGGAGGAGGAGSEQLARNGTADGAVKGGTLNILGTSDVDYLDPNVTYYSTGYTVARLIHRQLFANPADPATKASAQPDLAEQIPTAQNGGISADGKTYTITIKQGAQWNSTPPRQVTAADEVVGVKRSCNPAQPFGGLPDYQNLIAGYVQFCDGFSKVGQDAAAIKKYIQDTPLSGVTAKDDHTVVFTLNQPATYFVDMLALPSLSPVPVEWLDHVPGSTDLGQHLVVDGPYKVDTYDPTKRIELSRNPSWNQATDSLRGAFVDKVVIDETQSQESIQQQLQTGTPNADMMFDIGTPPSQIPGLLASDDPNLALAATNSSSPVPRLQHALTEQQQGPVQREGAAGTGLRDQPRQHHPGPGRPGRRAAAHPRPPAEHPRLPGQRPVPVRPEQGQADAGRRGLPQRVDAEVPLPQRL